MNIDNQIQEWAHLCGDDDNQRLSHYREYYQKSEAFMYEYRANRVSDLLTINDMPLRTPLSEGECSMFALNYPQRLTSLIREHESHIEYMNEGLLVTYPIEKMIEKYRKFCNATLDVKLKGLTIGSVCKDITSKQGNTSIVNYFYHDKNNPSLIVFRFPFYRGGDVEEFIREMVDSVYLTGYNLSMYDKIKPSSVMQPFGESKIDVWVIQFEAKFSEPNPQLSNVLYHVTPSRYFDKVKVQGLIPRSKSDRFKYPERVYLFNTTDIKGIEKYGLQKMNLLKQCHASPHVNDNGFYVFSIKRSSIESYQPYIDKKTVFYLDPCYDGGLGGIHQSKAIFTYNNIPRNLLENECWYYELDDSNNIKKKSNVDIKASK